VRIAIASDEQGKEIRERLTASLVSAGHELADPAPSRAGSSPSDYAEQVSLVVLRHDAERGIIITGRAVGASVAANKIRDVRAGLCHDCYSAHQGVEHDEMNVLVLGSRVIGPELAHDVVTRFLSAKFTGEERHVRRLAKVKELERTFLAG